MKFFTKLLMKNVRNGKMQVINDQNNVHILFLFAKEQKFPKAMLRTRN